jgi:hypothetical protein
MKKIYLTLFILFAAKISNAQLTLTKAFNSPVSGNVFTTNEFDSTTALNRQTGLNKVWNYSSVVSGTQTPNVTTYTTASSVPGLLSSFPTANLARYYSILGPNADFDVLKLNASNDEVLGTYSGTNAITYSNTQIEMIYPFTYGTNYSDVSGYSVGTGTNTESQNINLTVNGTGTGTIILPGNITLTNCLQVKGLQIVSGISSGFPISFTSTTLAYFHSSQKFPVATLNYGYFTVFSTTSPFVSFSINNNTVPVGIKENNNNVAFNLFPNPVNDKITISFDVNMPKDLKVSINDATGKLVRTEIINTDLCNTIDLANLEKGIYTLTLNATGFNSRKKFIKN